MSQAIAPHRRARYFYGWNIVAVAFLASFSHQAQINSILGVFVKPMERDLGFSRTAISGVQTLARLMEGGLAPVVGALVDRGWGKGLMVGGALVAGGGLLLLSQVQEVWQLYLVKGVIVGTGMVCFGGLVVFVAVNNWFVAKRGRALGIVGMGASLGTILFVPLLTWIVTTTSWRWGWAILGVSIWGTVLLPAALFMVRRPEDLGLRPDGEPPVEGSSQAQPARSLQEETTSFPPQSQIGLEEESWTRGEAVRTRTFWLLVLTLGIGQMASQAVNLHLIPYLQDLGYSAAIAALAVTARSAMQLVGSPFWGFVVERVELRYLACGKFLLYAVGIFVLMQASSLTTILAAVLLYGIAQAGTNVVTEVMWANYYGRMSLGAIRGVGMPFTVGFSAAGPLLAGAIYDLTKSYQGAFLLIIGGAAVSAVLVLFCTRPRRQVRPP